MLVLKFLCIPNKIRVHNFVFLLFAEALRIKKFRLGLPYYLDHLRDMFHGIVVDGRTSYVPDQEDVQVEDDDIILNSLTSTNSRKSLSNTLDTETSPPKRIRTKWLGL